MDAQTGKRTVLKLVLVLLPFMFASSAWSDNIPFDETDILFASPSGKNQFFIATEGIVFKNAKGVLSLDKPAEFPIELVRRDGSGGAWFTFGGLSLNHIDSDGRNIASALHSLPIENPIIALTVSPGGVTVTQLCGGVMRLDASGQILKRVVIADDADCKQVVTASDDADGKHWIGFDDGSVLWMDFQSDLPPKAKAELDVGDSLMAIVAYGDNTAAIQSRKGVLFRAERESGRISLQKVLLPQGLGRVSNIFSLGEDALVGFNSGALAFLDRSGVHAALDPSEGLSAESGGISFVATTIDERRRYAIVANSRGEIYRVADGKIKKLANVQSPIVELTNGKDGEVWVICRDQVYKIFQNEMFEAPELSAASNPAIHIFEQTNGLWVAHFYGGATFHAHPASFVSLNGRKIVGGKFSASISGFDTSIAPVAAYAVLADGNTQSVVRASISANNLSFEIPSGIQRPRVADLRAYTLAGFSSTWRERSSAPVDLVTDTTLSERIADFAKDAAIFLGIFEALLLSFLFARYKTSPIAQAIVWRNPTLRKTFTLGILDALLNVQGVARFLVRPIVERFNRRNSSDAFYFDGIRAVVLEDDGSWSEPQILSEKLAEPFGRTLLTGRSGSGKSVYVRHLVHLVQSPVVLIGARKCEDGVVAAVYARLPEEASDFKIIERALAIGALGIVIDGYNEASPVARMRILDFCLRYATANIIVTSQPSIMPDLPDYKRLQIIPLDMEKAESYLTEAIRHDNTRPFGPVQVREIVESLIFNDKSGIGITPFDLDLVKQLLEHKASVSNADILFQFIDNVSSRYKEKFFRELPVLKIAELAYNERKNDSSRFLSEDFTLDELSFFRDERLIVTGGGATEQVYAFRHERLQDWFVANFLRVRQDIWKEAAAIPVMAQAFTMLVALLSQERRSLVVHIVAEIGAMTGDHTIIDSVMMYLQVTELEHA
jgi:hypothetical protein